MITQELFMREVAQKLYIADWKDWYKFSRKDILDLGGSYMLSKYQNSYSKLVMSTHPNRPWDPSSFEHSPNYWSIESNQREFMKRLEKQLNIEDWRDWYRVTAKDIKQSGGVSLLSGYYGDSRSQLIMSMYPEHPWNILDFGRVPQNYWGTESNQREFMKKLEKKLDISEWKDWYRVSKEDIINSGGRTLLNEYYRGSPPMMIMALRPEHPWNIHHFKVIPRYYWGKKSNQEEFMKNLEEKLGISEWKDWYHITAKDIYDAGGGVLLNGYYEHSPYKLIAAMFPQHPWNIFEFRTKISWNPQVTQSFLNHVASLLKIQSTGSWRTLSTVQIKDFRGGRSLLRQTGSLYKALALAYPAADWDFLKNIKMSRSQNAIVDILCKYIQRNFILVNHRHPDLIHKSGVRAELDIWIPSLNLAIEYQGEHHYHQLWQRSQHPSDHEKRDAEKRSLCREAGIDLVEVPYWWNRSAEQLLAIIRNVQPSFLESIEKFQRIVPIQHTMIPRQGNSTITWRGGIDYHSLKIINGWITSEKLDGIRCHYDGSHIYSRGNHLVDHLQPIAIPLQDHVVDGELWYQRCLRFGFGSLRPELIAFDVLSRHGE